MQTREPEFKSLALVKKCWVCFVCLQPYHGEVETVRVWELTARQPNTNSKLLVQGEALSQRIRRKVVRTTSEVLWLLHMQIGVSTFLNAPQTYHTHTYHAHLHHTHTTSYYSHELEWGANNKTVYFWDQVLSVLLFNLISELLLLLLLLCIHM